ncbi:hypothetical protein H1R20_g1257, partial [Candolleomyces eurysporus]
MPAILVLGLPVILTPISAHICPYHTSTLFRPSVMAATGRGWPTEEMNAFLEARKDAYNACRKKKKYRTFFNHTACEWSVEFPIIEELFPGRKFPDLSVDEKKQHAEAWMKRQEQIKDWYRWHCNPRQRTTATSDVLRVQRAMVNIIYEKDRRKKPYEKFAELYPDDVENEYRDACAEENKTGKECLPVWTRVAKSKWKNATPEQVKAVEDALDADEKGKESGDPESVEQKQKLVDSVPGILSAALGPLAQKSGLAFFVTYIGPFPGSGGAVKMRTIQHGEHDDAPVLGEICPDYEQMMLDRVAPYYNLHVRSMCLSIVPCFRR